LLNLIIVLFLALWGPTLMTLTVAALNDIPSNTA
jgi:hypothetical protein